MTAAFSWSIPDELNDFYERFNARLTPEAHAVIVDAFQDDDTLREQWHVSLKTSVFIQEETTRRPALFTQLLSSGQLTQSLSEADFDQQLSDSHSLDESAFNTRLREFRARSMVRIIWRDFNRVADFNETTDDLSHLASACINAALTFHYEKLCEKHGTPRNKKGEAQPLLVMAMGKLGAKELNLSSDIDLIFTFPENGVTDGTRDLTNHEFFSRLGKKLIHSLDAQTADGMVFRVDMRLRPYGQSGALVYSFNALEEYYLTQGREWERYAMVKASVIANNGDAKHTRALMAMLKDFTYRKYIDFSVIDALRGLKKMITQEVKRRRLDEDVKLGAGGIREIEFTAQVFQLIRGGRDPELQDNRLLNILPTLENLQCLPADTVALLTEAYIFLRNTEHGIQGYHDEQTQRLPQKPAAQKALAAVMGFSEWDDFYQQLNKHRHIVKTVFADVIAEPDSNDNQKNSAHQIHEDLWQQQLDEDDAITHLRSAGHEDPNQSLALLRDLENWASHASMHSSSRTRLDAFMPILLNKLAHYDAPSETLKRLIKLIKAIARRSAYLLLLMENPVALTQLLRLVEASPWVAATMADHPALLDELLYPDSLYHPPEKAELDSELRRSTLRIDEDDLETQMESLRYFRSAHALRVAASEITGVLPLMKVSDYLTWIAETILDYVLHLSWQALVKKHGYPDGQAEATPPFIIVAYGKLGGIELGHGSDLDLVFIHNADINGVTDGDRSIDNQTFFLRLGQKIIHFLTTTMSSGALYEVDMRLRPSGNSGMLVASLGSFEKYQHEAAWTWEHQALVRARVVAGDPKLAKDFEAIRTQVLCQSRDHSTLRDEVIEMREKMRKHLGSKESDRENFHIKHDAGGIVDIEFMVQYGVLAWAHSHPALVAFTDNIRILESFTNSNLLEAQEVDQLTEAYKAFRTAGHRLTLQQRASVLDGEQLAEERAHVSALWQRLMLDKT